MKKIILAALVAATVLTPVASQAANVAPTAARNSIANNSEALFQRDESRRGEGRRGGGEGRRNGENRRGENRRGENRGGENRRSENRAQRAAQQQAQAPQVQAPQAQAPQNQRGQRNWPQERGQGEVRRSNAERGQITRQGRPDAQQDGRYYDRNRDGNLDRRWDRNRDGNLDRNYDSNRDGRLDRRLDRNDDERIDRRYDRNRNGDIDRRYDRNNDNRVDRWSNNWRNDSRYDWRGHRQRYSNYYRPGRYYSPYRGHNYSRINIGFSLGSGYYGSRYWIDDPWQYRLPAAYGSYRWVRYYDDVLLVDLRSGRVVDVIRDFFW